MRLHQLTVSAFGPFAGTEQIDFSELNDAGLFLLTGPTGAGKTSILDAICFALYGSVPGVRGVKTLRSQHAPADARPEVVLDFSIRERRFVLRRSPEWSRPKRRGSGTTDEKSAATLVEKTSGVEHLLSSRAQEVGHLISELIGMNAAQFVQVAMLPQGEFQKFLRATSQERHDVLQHLFKTDRFARIEDWVHDHSRRLRETASSGEGAVQRILDTMADRASVDLPDELSDPGLNASAAADGVLPWAKGLLSDADALLVRVRASHDTAVAAVATARSQHMQATRVCSTYARRDAANASLAGLESGQIDEDAASTELERDSRASGCRPTLLLLDESLAEHSRVTRERADALNVISGCLPEGPETATAAMLSSLAKDARTRVARLEVLLPREAALASARRELIDAEFQITGLHEQVDDASERHKAIPQERDALRARIVTYTETARRRDVLASELVAARRKLQAAQQLPDRQLALSQALDDSRGTRDRAADARQRMQDLVDRRLAGIAAELAARLEDGEACQVCGSIDHPQLAEPAPDAVTKLQQEQATADLDDFTAKHDLATARVSEVQRQVAGLLQTADGLDATEAAVQETDLVAALKAAETAETERVAAEGHLEQLDNELETLITRLHELTTRLAALGQAAAGLQQTIQEIAAEINDVTGKSDGAVSLSDALPAERAVLASLEKAVASVTCHEQSSSRMDQLNGQARAAVKRHGFGSVDEAHAATLTPELRATYQSTLRERADLRLRAQAVLGDAEVRAASAQPPDLIAVAAALDLAETSEDVAARALHQQEQLVASLRTNLARLDHALVGWAPARDDFVRADAMSKLVRGMGGDNQLQMRLSAYVLATRLDQVVAAANERLAHMRDQRYLLERTGRSARKGAQAGLGLQVVDEWTGDARDPATLSGGETFVVSLSLALGLADVVTQEAGGTDIETLFIDEGFGMLDPDTLDDVMDRLDGLRAGGRTVGVVSHVSELRNRIPTQVHVEKRRTGSSIAIRTLVP